MKFLIIKISFFIQLVLATSVFAQYNFDIIFANGKLAFSQKDYYEAINKFNKCVDIKPENAEVYFYRGLCKYVLFDNIGAEHDFSMAIIYHNFLYSDALNYRSLTKYRLGKYVEAINDINKVIEKEPSILKNYLQRAYFYLANDNYNASLNDCAKLIDAKSSIEEASFCKAKAEEALLDYKNAIKDYDKVVEINPKNIDAYAYRGMTKFKMDSINNAIADFNLALKLDSTCTLANYFLAEVEMKLEHYDKALDFYNKVLKYEPRNSYAYFGRGALYANIKKYSLAISDFNKVLIINPNNIEALFNRAKLKQTVKDYIGAINDYDKITSLFPYFAEAYFMRSQAKYCIKDLEGAKKDMDKGRVMGDVFRSQNKMFYNKDSLLFNKLTYLSADFHNSSDIKPDNVNTNFLPIFYLSEKDSINYKTKNFSLLIDNFNWKYSQNLCLKNDDSFDIDSSLVNSISKNTSFNNNNSLLLIAIYKSNMQLFNDAKFILDSLLATDSLNVIALFARGVNTCRELEFQKNNNDDYYIIVNPNQEKNEKLRKAKCNSAINDFSKTIKLVPDFYFALYNRAYVKCLLSDYYGANFDYDQAIKKYPLFADAYFNNGFLLYYLNIKQAACENFSKAGELGLKQAFDIIQKQCNGSLY